ncbi:hypothetical protein SMSP2_00569 [Limihaloglobus sulfuriphilus]|uniref:Beta-xylosidase n=1 Tax=Limihaloglobus sulfuriphilus TaxID=1851148 RepID=A0A1Q2MBZ6_9BACT|nr:hypothetical protein [Limihaloglobus sulfuriphilus]AQQ70226.1 hypothetical protein SMSP2_00569 [Limihaloglobus sulfuriphilus]
MRISRVIQFLILTTVFAATSAVAVELTNGGFEDGDTDWRAYAANGAVGNFGLTTDSYEGSNAFSFEITDSPAGSDHGLDRMGSRFSAFAGDDLEISAAVKKVSSDNTVLRVYVSEWDDGGSYLGVSSFYALDSAEGNYTLNTFNYSVTNPDTTECDIKFKIFDENGLKSSGHYYIDAVDVLNQEPPVYTGELLYNGIRLQEEWPPNNIDPNDESPMAVPYLMYPPEVIPIDIGRQLFFDDFLIENTDLVRTFHKPEKYKGNPVLKPETEIEINEIRTNSLENGELGNAAAAPKSGGVWWDPDDELFKMWYEAGWLGTIALATSQDGINWERPHFDINPGTNQVLPLDLIPDSWTVARNWDAQDPQEKWTLFLSPPAPVEGGPWSLTSPDGIHWNQRVQTGPAGDRSTHFYNPFRKKWVYSLRAAFDGRGRARHYYECDDFMQDAQWTNSDKVVWLMTDEEDPYDYLTQFKPQLYNFDAVAYESIMLGFAEILQGPANPDCAKVGLPKITELMFSYSRDGFHWHRPDRRAHIQAERSDVWDRGYVQSAGNICLVRGDKLWFYYSAFRGNESKKGNSYGLVNNGMYDNGSTGVAFMRRDGFASLDAGSQAGNLTTRKVEFSGNYLFVNVDTRNGKIRAEIQDVDGSPIEPFTLENSIPFTGDSTIEMLNWSDGSDLSELAGTPVRLHFELTNGSIYSFWISKDSTGRSDGYVAGGGAGFTGATDTVGISAYEAELDIAENSDWQKPNADLNDDGEVNLMDFAFLAEQWLVK